MLSKREKVIALLTVVVLAALVGDRFVFTPLMDKLNQLETRRLDLHAELNDVQNLFQRRRLMERKWREMAGERLSSAFESESRMLHALDRWARGTGLTLTSVKPLRWTVAPGSTAMAIVSISPSASTSPVCRTSRSRTWPREPTWSRASV